MPKCEDCKPDTETTNVLPYKIFESKTVPLCYTHYKERVKEDTKIMRKVCS